MIAIPLLLAGLLATQDPEPAEIQGRFLLPDGSPATGVGVRLKGMRSNSDLVIKYGLPENWKDPAPIITDAEGRFSIRFEAPLAFQFFLDAKLASYAEVSWRWSVTSDEIYPGKIMNVGTIALRETGTIAGYLLTPDGSPPAGEHWWIYADCDYRPPGPGGDETRISAQPDPSTGYFRMADVPPGRVQLKASSPIAARGTRAEIDVVAGQEAEVELIYRGPDVGSRIVITPSVRPFHFFDTSPESITLSGQKGALTSRKVPGSARSFSFDDLSPGVYTATIDDPRFLPWSQGGLHPGQVVDPHLIGRGRLALEVRDADTGERDRGLSAPGHLRGRIREL